MNIHFSLLSAIAVAASAVSTPLHRAEAQQPSAAVASPCSADANYQRLAFWIGDWEVVDSLGSHYATQRVRAILDGCAITAEWTGRVGDKGLSVFGFDVKTGDWKQVYLANQMPYTTGVPVRRSDPSYSGPGIRFISLVDPPNGDLARSRVTTMPASDHRVLQLFEDSSDGGKTWHTLFKAEHRPQGTTAP